MPGMSKHCREDREVSGDRTKVRRASWTLGIRLGEDHCQFARLLRVTCGSPRRRQIATRRGQQLDTAIRARLPIPLSFAIAPVLQGAPLFCRCSGVAGPASERNAVQDQQAYKNGRQ